MRRRRSAPLRGRNPSTQKRSVGSPLTTSAPSTDDGPGHGADRLARGGQPRRQPGAGVRDAGRPRVADHRHRRAAGHGGRDTLEPGRLVVPVQREQAVAAGPAAVIPSAERSARVRRVSSQQIRSAVASTSRARGERSPRFPIGVATSTSWPRRSPLKARRSLRRSAPRAPRAGRRPARPSARARRPRPRPRCGRRARRRATRHGFSRATRTTVRSTERKATSIGNFMPTVCTVRTPVDVQRPLAARCAPAGPRRSAGESAISSAHTTSPSRSSHPDRIRRRGYRTGARRTGRSNAVALHVEANGQAQAPDQEEGQPRQEAELRPRLRPAPPARVTDARAVTTRPRRRPGDASTPHSVVGTSEMIPSTPRSTRRSIDSVSLTVHTWTALPARCAASTNRSSTTTRSPWRSGTWKATAGMSGRSLARLHRPPDLGRGHRAGRGRAPSGAKRAEGVGRRVEERRHDHVVGAAELGQQAGQRLLVGRDDGRRLLDVEVQHHAGERFEDLAQGGDAEGRVRRRPAPERVVAAGRPGVTSAPGIHQ